MSGPRIFFENAITATGLMTISSTNPAFPRLFLLDEARKTPWRSASLGTPSVTIDIDLGASTAVRAFALLNTNFSSGTYRLYSGATNPATNVVTLTTKNQSLWLSMFATRTSRYWRFSMREAGIASAFYQIGEIHLGQYAQLSKYHAGNTQEVRDSGVKILETDGGARWRLSGFKRKTKSYKFVDITEDGDYAIWDRVFESCGLEHPFIYIVNPSIPSGAFYCVLQDSLSIQRPKTDFINLDVKLAEEL